MTPNTSECMLAHTCWSDPLLLWPWERERSEGRRSFPLIDTSKRNCTKGERKRNEAAKVHPFIHNTGGPHGRNVLTQCRNNGGLSSSAFGGRGWIRLRTWSEETRGQGRKWLTRWKLARFCMSLSFLPLFQWRIAQSQSRYSDRKSDSKIKSFQ